VSAQSGTRVRSLVVHRTAIEGLWHLEAKAVTDERGTVRELFRLSGYTELGIGVPERWSQLNLTWTGQGGIRGLHGEAMTKLVGVAHGQAYGVYLDTRTGSPTRGTVVTTTLTPGHQMLVPPGVCNGFQAISDGGCQYLYCFDAEWRPDMTGTAVTPLDPDLAIVKRHGFAAAPF